MDGVRILVDDRELRGAPIPDELACPAEVQRLEVGDFMLVRGQDALCLFERKSLADMSASIRDGRYREQKQRLRAWRDQATDHNHHARRVFYVVEGSLPGQGPSSVLTAHPADSATAGDHALPASAVQTALFKLMVDNKIGVFFTRDAVETWKVVEGIAQRIAAGKFVAWGAGHAGPASCVAPPADSGAGYLSCVKLKKADNLAGAQDVALLQLTVIPRVSVAAARAILAATRSTTVAGVASYLSEHGTATLADLKVGSKRLGQALVSRLRDLLLGSQPPDRPAAAT